MYVHVVDPSAYTPPYDHALCRALGEAGVQAELITSRFAYGEVPPPRAYTRREPFYRLAHRGSISGPRSRSRLALKLAEHVPDMLRYSRSAQGADIVHFQWLTAQPLDVHLLPRPGAKGRPKLVLTAHDVLPREPSLGQRRGQRSLYGRMDAIVVHSEHGRERLRRELGIADERIEVIPHGLLAPWEDVPAPLPAPFAGVQGPVVLFIGLLRPYKGLDVLLEAWRGIEEGPAGEAPGRDAAELWIVGMPRMDMAPLRALIAAAGAQDAGPVRLLERFVSGAELLAFLERASVVALPYREIDQSGVAFTALAAATPLLLSDVGGFPELAATGAARTVPAGDPRALRQALIDLIEHPEDLAKMAAHARALAASGGRYSWQSIARAHISLYERLLAPA